MFTLVYVRNHPPGLKRKRESNSARGNLREGYPHENQAPQHQVNSHQWTDHPDQQTDVDRIAEQEIGIENLAERFHITETPSREVLRFCLVSTTRSPRRAGLSLYATR